MKCVTCKKLIEDDQPHVVLPDSNPKCGSRGLYRKPTKYSCLECWAEAVRSTDKSRAEFEAKTKRQLAEAMAKLTAEVK